MFQSTKLGQWICLFSDSTNNKIYNAKIKDFRIKLIDFFFSLLNIMTEFIVYLFITSSRSLFRQRWI